MSESILTSIKKSLGIVEEYEHFDPDLIMHINSVFVILNQIGISPHEGFYIEDKTTTWADFNPNNRVDMNLVKSYISLKVKLLFDPPASSSILENYKAQIAEHEWRLSVLSF